MTRSVLAILLCWCVLSPALPTALPSQEIRVTLLGTGSPKVSTERSGPSILVQAGERTLIFDAGRGALQRLSQAGVNFGQVDALFLTHLHSDHVVGLPDLWLSGWLLSRRDRPLAVFGPAGTAAMLGNLEHAFAFDIRTREVEGQLPPRGVEVRVTEIEQGVVYDSAGVRVTAFEVDHGPVRPAFGYRIDYAGRSVVLSGDTRPSPNLIAFAAHADLLIHEVADGSERYIAAHPFYVRVLALHTRPREAGEIFTRIRPKLAVYSHIVLSDVTPEELIARTRESYSGPLEVGSDLMRFDVGTLVTVHRQ
ncbi:MAG TPA: MBL fold metallo-hydrolase [Gemmatimonadaceae bacterium]|nr:MBL fold metallo-hydrolase [Gemmatimonadaceae bacterium]